MISRGEQCPSMPPPRGYGPGRHWAAKRGSVSPRSLFKPIVASRLVSHGPYSQITSSFSHERPIRDKGLMDKGHFCAFAARNAYHYEERPSRLTKSDFGYDFSTVNEPS